MPKLKTNKGARKRLKVTATGKIKRTKAGKRHILTKKSSKRKTALGKATLVDKSFEKKMRNLLPR